MTMPPVTPAHLILMPAYGFAAGAVTTVTAGAIGGWAPIPLLVGVVVGIVLVRLTGRYVHAGVHVLAARVRRAADRAQERLSGTDA